MLTGYGNQAQKRGRLAGMFGGGQSGMGMGLGPAPVAPTAPMAPLAPAAPAAAAATATAPQAGAGNGQAQAPHPMFDLGLGNERNPRGPGPKAVQRRLGQLGYRNAFRAQPGLWDSIERMLDTANPENRAANLAPQMQAIGDFQRRSSGAAAADAIGRGIDGGSYDGAMQGAISSGADRMRADAVSGQVQREEQATAANAAFLQAMSAGDTRSAAAIMGQIVEQRQRQAELDQAGEFDWGALFGSAAGAAAQYYGAKGR